MFTIFLYVIIGSPYITSQKQWKWFSVDVFIGSVMVVGVLTRCALLHFVCDLKSQQINVYWSLFKELIIFKFDQDHNAAKII